VLIAVYALARRLSGEGAALIALALAAGASPLVECSAQARGYTMLTLAFLLLFLAEDDRIRALLIAAGAWTIPTMLYGAAAWAVWFAITRREWRRLAAVALMAGSLTFLLYVPILVVTGLESIVANGNTLSVPYARFVPEFARMLAETARAWSLSFTTAGGIGCAAAPVCSAVCRR